MILLDINVISEAMKPDQHPAVRDWLDAQAAEILHLSRGTIAELMFGIGALRTGKRKDKLVAALDGVLELFASKILSDENPQAPDPSCCFLSGKKQYTLT